MILLQELLVHYETKNWKNWKRFPDLPAGGKSMEIDDELYLKGFREEILEDIRLLEREGLIFLKNDDWRERNYDAARIRYRMENIEGVYRLAGCEPIWVRWERQKADLAGWRKGIATPWINRSLDEWEEKLSNGTVFAASDWAHRERVCRCLQGLDELERLSQEDSPQFPMYLRVFSNHYLGNSKEFHGQYEKTVIGMPRRLNPGADADSEALDEGPFFVSCILTTTLRNSPSRVLCASSWLGNAWTQPIIPMGWCSTSRQFAAPACVKSRRSAAS